MTRVNGFHLALANNFRLTIGIQDQTITRPRGATCFDSVDAHLPQELVCVTKHVIQSTPAPIERDLAFLLGNIKAEAGFVHCVPSKTRHVFSCRIRQRPDLVIDAVRVDKTRAVHLQLFGQRIHLRDERINWRVFRLAGRDRLYLRADVVRERIGRNIIGLDKRSVEKISQGDAIAWLKTNVVFKSAYKRLLRDRDCLVEIARSSFRPIEHHTRSRDFRQATNLQFFPRFLLFQNVARLRIGNKIRLCASS